MCHIVARKEGSEDIGDDVDKMSEKLNERCATADILLSIRGWERKYGTWGQVLGIHP